MVSDFLSTEVLAQMDAARRRDLKRKSRLRISDGRSVYPVLRTFSDGFSIDASEVSHLRGIVDLYEGSRHLSQCLIMAADIVGGELVCKLKWQTAATDRPALDYVRNEHAPVGYLPYL